MMKIEKTKEHQNATRQLEAAMKDVKRMDWLADKRNNVGNVQLPREIVESNLPSLRDAIDEAMEAYPVQ